jgi:hypothetical protein
VVLRYSSQLWGPKPFRFNNFWLDHEEIGEVVNHSWNRSRPTEWMAVRLSAKLKTLKVTSRSGTLGLLVVWMDELMLKLRP